MQGRNVRFKKERYLSIKSWEKPAFRDLRVGFSVLYYFVIKELNDMIFFLIHVMVLLEIDFLIIFLTTIY